MISPQLIPPSAYLPQALLCPPREAEFKLIVYTHVFMPLRQTFTRTPTHTFSLVSASSQLMDVQCHQFSMTVNVSTHSFVHIQQIIMILNELRGVSEFVNAWNAELF